MRSQIIAPLRKVVHAVLGASSPGHLAAGFTLGMIVGLMPKGNLVALSLVVLLFSLRCNRGLALLAAVLFSYAAPWTDPFAHRLGTLVLTHEPLQAMYASVFSVPLGPWLGFHNTVVTGSMLLGLYAAYPVFWITRALCGAIPRGAPR